MLGRLISSAAGANVLGGQLTVVRDVSGTAALGP
jgi:hypothetical protein